MRFLIAGILLIGSMGQGGATTDLSPAALLSSAHAAETACRSNPTAECSILEARKPIKKKRNKKKDGDRA